MRKTFLKIGISLLITGFDIAVISLWLLIPMISASSGKVFFGLVAAGVFSLLGFIATSLSLIFIFTGKRVAANYKARLQPEGIVFFEEDLNGSMTFLNLRRPGGCHKRKKTAIAAPLVLTGKRLLALKGSNPIIDVPLTDARLRQMDFSLEDEKTLLVRFQRKLKKHFQSRALF